MENKTSSPRETLSVGLDINTAPTDGTLFIGLKGNHAAPTRRGKYYVKWPHEPGGPTFMEEWNQEQPDHVFPWKPTHWIPFPATPNAVKENKV